MDRTVGPYRLGDALGTSPFGELVAATHPARSETLAVLLLDERLAKEYRLRGLMRLENARAGGLRHPALARTIEIGEHAGAPYVVFERPASGTTLAQAVAAGTAPSPDQATALLRQLAEGLDAAHGRRLLHGAVSPGTVLVSADGSGSLFGIGLLAAVEEAGLVPVLAESMAGDWGDAPFVAPEQRTGKRAVASADGYALGVLARTLLPGSTGLSKAADAVLTRQCADDPAARYPTCTAFVTALAEALPPAGPISEPSPATPTEPASPPPPTIPEPAAFAPSWTPHPSTPPSSGSTPTTVAPPWAPPTSTPPATTGQPSLGSSSTATPRVQTPSPAPLPTPSPSAAPPLTDHFSPPAAPPLTDRSSPPPTPLPDFSSPPAPTMPAPSHPAAPPLPREAPTPSLSAIPAADSRPAASSPGVEPPAAAAPPDGLASWDRPGSQATAAPDVLPWDTPPGPRTAEPGSASSSNTRPIEWSEPEGKPFTVGTSPVTDAMRAGLARAEQRDPLGDAVRWAAGHSATLLHLLDRYCPDGRFGPVPLGIAAAMVLATLFLIARQPVLATSVVGLVLVLYMVPSAARRLTASERPKPLAVSVAGPARLGERTVGLGWKAYEIEAANGTTLRLSPAGYQRLTRIGRPVTVERPSTVAAGTQQVTVGHEIADVVVTYLASSTILFDVRRPDGTVLVRNPAYQGEPGDSVDAESASTVPADPKWRRSSRGQSIVLPMPAAVRDSLERAARLQLRWLVLTAGLPLALVLLTINTGAAGFAVVMLIGVYLTFGARALERTLKLRSARNATELVRVVGPVLVSHYANDKTARYRMRLEDDAVLSIDAETHGRLARLGQMRMGEDRSVFWDERSRSEHLISEHEVPSVIVTYEPTAPVLFEILNAFSAPVYRDPDISPNDLPRGEPRA